MSKEDIVNVARRILGGELHPLEGCRSIVALSGDLSEAERGDPDLLTFAAIESEIDDLPTAATRHLWDPAALTEHVRRGEAYPAQVHDTLFAACSSIIEKFSKRPTP